MPRSSGVDSFDSMLLGIRAKGGWLEAQNTRRLSVLDVVNGCKNNLYVCSSVGGWAAKLGECRYVWGCANGRGADVRMTLGGSIARR